MLLHHNADYVLPHAHPSCVVIVKPNHVVKKGEQITPYFISAKAYYLFARNLRVRGFVLFSPRPLWVFMRFKSIRLLPSLIANERSREGMVFTLSPIFSFHCYCNKEKAPCQWQNEHLFVKNLRCRKFTTPCQKGKTLSYFAIFGSR